MTSRLATLPGALLLAALALATGGASAHAQAFVRIENRWRAGWQLHTEWDTVSVSTAPAGWWSADWVLEPAGPANTYRIKNRFRGTYLNIERGPLVASAVPAGFLSSQWVLEPVDSGYYRIRNLWKGTYLHTEHAVIEVGAAPAGWWSAQWKLPPSGSAAAAAPAAALIVDPACLAPVGWAVQPEGEDIRLTGCRPASALPAPGEGGWRTFQDNQGQTIDTRGEERDAATGALTFTVRWNGGGSATFVFEVRGVPTADGVLKAGTFTVREPTEK